MSRPARRARRGRPAAAVLLLLALAACGGGGAGAGEEDAGGAGREAGAVTEPAAPGSGRDRPEAEPPAVEPVRCPEGVADCRVATGEIVYLERVDPDGDGDAHFVLADPQGITARGLTAIDVRHGLRPVPLPGLGDSLSAAGPVQTGSYGQSQIHALRLRVARRGEG